MSGPPIAFQADAVKRAAMLARRAALGETLKPLGRESERRHEAELMEAAARSFAWMAARAEEIRAFAALPADLREAVTAMTERELRTRLGVWPAPGADAAGADPQGADAAMDGTAQ